VSRKTYAVDWDGTLVEYHGYKGPGVFGAPVPAMVQRVHNWIRDGHEVIIFTSRVSVEHDPQHVMINCKMIDECLRAMGLPLLEITANKYIRITEFWDDRAVRVERNSGCEDLGVVQRS
jgi:hypothetical protein